MREGRVVARERPVARDRGSYGDDRQRQRPVAFVDVDVVGEPEPSRVAQLVVGARHVEITGPDERERDVLHRLERRAHEDLEPLAFGTHEHSDRDVARHFVGSRLRRQRSGGRRYQQEKAPHALGPAPGSRRCANFRYYPRQEQALYNKGHR